MLPNPRQASTPPLVRTIVVDNTPAVAEGIARLLGQCGQFKVLALGSNGREALQLAARLAPDLVVLDVHMPQMGGLEAADEIHRTYPDIRILMVSIDGDARTREQVFAHGADAFVPKFRLHRELIAEIGRLFPSLAPAA